MLLVQAFTALDMELVFPLGLAYLASHLGAEHAVEIMQVQNRMVKVVRIQQRAVPAEEAQAA